MIPASSARGERRLGADVGPGYYYQKQFFEGRDNRCRRLTT
jgi:hypothetical protein